MQNDGAILHPAFSEIIPVQKLKYVPSDLLSGKNIENIIGKCVESIQTSILLDLFDL